MAEQSKAWVWGLPLAGFAGSNPVGGMSVCLFWREVCCQLQVTASGWSLVQKSPTEYGVSEYDREACIMWRPWPNSGCCFMNRYMIS